MYSNLQLSYIMRAFPPLVRNGLERSIPCDGCFKPSSLITIRTGAIMRQCACVIKKAARALLLLLLLFHRR